MAINATIGNQCGIYQNNRWGVGNSPNSQLQPAPPVVLIDGLLRKLFF